MKRFWRRFRVSQSFRMSIWAGLLVLLLGVLIFGTNAAALRSYAVEGNKALVAEEVIHTAQDALTQPLLGPLFSGNRIFFPEARAEEVLKSTFPRIANVALTRNIRNGHVRISITEREATAIYCAGREIEPVTDEEETVSGEEAGPKPQELGTFPEVTVEACYLMDAGAIAFAGAPETEGSLIMTIIDTEAGEVFYGDQVLTHEVLSEMRMTWDTFTQGIAIRPRRVLKRKEGVITIETFEGWEAVMSLTYPLEGQVIALRELLAKELAASERRTITVIDLRVPGRIYYR